MINGSLFFAWWKKSRTRMAIFKVSRLFRLCLQGSRFYFWMWKDNEKTSQDGLIQNIIIKTDGFVGKISANLAQKIEIPFRESITRAIFNYSGKEYYTYVPYFLFGVGIAIVISVLPGSNLFMYIGVALAALSLPFILSGERISVFWESSLLKKFLGWVFLRVE